MTKIYTSKVKLQLSDYVKARPQAQTFVANTLVWWNCTEINALQFPEYERTSQDPRKHNSDSVDTTVAFNEWFPPLSRFVLICLYVITFHCKLLTYNVNISLIYHKF